MGTDTYIKPNSSGVVVSPDDFGDEDDDEMYTTIAFDPGGTTGWAVFQVYLAAIEDESYRIKDNITFWTAGEFRGTESIQADQMFELVEAWPDAKVVIEDFILRKFSSARELLSPVRITERLDDRMYCNCPNRPLIKQPASLAMTTVTDIRLKKMGLYNALSGQEHARDAVRHNITWMKRAKQIYQRNAITSALSGGES